MRRNKEPNKSPQASREVKHIPTKHRLLEVKNNNFWGWKTKKNYKLLLSLKKLKC